MTLTASIAGVTDADNVSSGGAITNPVDWAWESELEPGSNLFSPIVRVDLANDEFAVRGESLELTAAESGLQIRVVGTFQDEALVFEAVTSAPVQVTGEVVVPGGPALGIRFATFTSPAVQQRLRVAGDVVPSTAIVELFAPGTTLDGVVCTGTPIAVLPVDVDLEFLFDQTEFPGGDPGTVCVQSDDGLGGGAVRAVFAGTT